MRTLRRICRGRWNGRGLREKGKFVSWVLVFSICGFLAVYFFVLCYCETLEFPDQDQNTKCLNYWREHKLCKICGHPMGCHKSVMKGYSGIDGCVTIQANAEKGFEKRAVGGGYKCSCVLADYEVDKQ